MRVVVACDWFLKYAAAQSAALAEHGLQVLLLCRSHAFEFGDDVDERERKLERARRSGVTVVEVPGRSSDPRAVPELARIRLRVKRFAPDIVHAHERMDPRILVLLPRVPTLVTVHDPVLHPGQPVAEGLELWVRDRAEQAWAARARVIVVHSKALVGEVELRPGQCCAVIPHGLDVLKSPLQAPVEPVVGFFGRLAPYKGLDVLAKSMPLVWKTRPEVRVRVTGDGEAEFPLHDPRARIERRYVPENEIQALFRRTSLAVLPYVQASQTGVGSIAAGLGIPVITSDVGGLPDLALDASYVFPAGDAVALARRIITHIDDGADVRQRVLERIGGPHSWNAVTARAIEVYQSILSHQ